MEEYWKIFCIKQGCKKSSWKPIVWECSTLGRFKRNGIIVEPHKHEKYLTICSERVHIIIAKTFIPNYDNKPCVDHIDGDVYNNSVSNLRWSTYKENNNNPITKQRLIDSQRKSEKYKNRIGWNYDKSGKNNPNYKHGKYIK